MNWSTKEHKIKKNISKFPKIICWNQKKKELSLLLWNVNNFFKDLCCSHNIINSYVSKLLSNAYKMIKSLICLYIKKRKIKKNKKNKIYLITRMFLHDKRVHFHFVIHFEFFFIFFALFFSTFLLHISYNVSVIWWFVLFSSVYA